MRQALPNAAFIGFTGTPLIAGQEERTREVFGDYVSIYNFAQSIADGATVPLYYEARKPELQLAADELKDELDALLDEAALDEEQEKKLQRTFGKEYHLITRNDRLDEIATDLVRHFSARGYLGKAMVVAIDKATAVRMYDKVTKACAAELAPREAQLAKAPEQAKTALTERLSWMRSVDMAVVVSQSQNEIDDLKQKGLDILPTGSACRRRTSRGPTVERDQGFLKVAERKIDDAAAEQQRQHWFAHDFNNDAKRRAPVAARELIKPFGLEAGLRLAFAQARHGGQG